MVNNRKALGRGLRALIPETESAGGDEACLIALELIEPNPFQPRKQFDEEKLQELASSIETHGVIEPIIVRRVSGTFQIIVGERRWRAAGLVGLEEIPAVVRDVSDKSMMEVALIENLQREDLNPIEEADGFQRLIDEFRLSQGEVALAVGKKRSSVANSLRLLGLDDVVKGLVIEGRLSRGHAKVLLGVNSVGFRQELAARCVEEELSVRQLERLLQPVVRVPRGTRTEKSADVLLIEEELQQSLGTKVNLEYKNGKGRIEIQYYSDEELERLLEFMKAKV